MKTIEFTFDIMQEQCISDPADFYNRFIECFREHLNDFDFAKEYLEAAIKEKSIRLLEGEGFELILKMNNDELDEELTPEEDEEVFDAMVCYSEMNFYTTMNNFYQRLEGFQKAGWNVSISDFRCISICECDPEDDVEDLEDYEATVHFVVELEFDGITKEQEDELCNLLTSV